MNFTSRLAHSSEPAVWQGSKAYLQNTAYPLIPLNEISLTDADSDELASNAGSATTTGEVEVGETHRKQVSHDRYRDALYPLRDS